MRNPKLRRRLLRRALRRSSAVPQALGPGVKRQAERWFPHWKAAAGDSDGEADAEPVDDFFAEDGFM